MGYTNSETWTTLAIELDRDPTFHHIIKGRYDLIIKRDTKEIKRFTEEDSNFIQTYVEKYGDSTSTWRELAIKFGTDHPGSIKRHYNNLLNDYVKGKFTKAEDKIILNDVEIHGNDPQTFKNLGKKLNRSHPHQIRDRFEYLHNKPSKKPGPWQIEEDQMLMEHFFQGSLNKMNNLDYLDSSKPKDFDQISVDIGRSKGACYNRWMFTIVPILKSDTLGLPQNEDWRKDVLRYVIEKKFGRVKEIPYNKLVRDVCPGQTSYSLSVFLNNLSLSAGDMPFYEYCRKQLNNPPPNSLLGNEELAKAKSEYASQILQIKRKLK